jgi:hypothetical protein
MTGSSAVDCHSPTPQQQKHSFPSFSHSLMILAGPCPFILIMVDIPSHALTPCSWVLEKPPFAQLLNSFPTFYGTWRLINVFTRALHWSLSWASWIQSVPPHPISLRSILMLFSHNTWGFSNGLFPSAFPTLLDLMILIVFGKGYNFWSSSLYSFLPASYYFVQLASRYSHHLVLKYFQSVYFL